MNELYKSLDLTRGVGGGIFLAISDNFGKSYLKFSVKIGYFLRGNFSLQNIREFAKKGNNIFWKGISLHLISCVKYCDPLYVMQYCEQS